MTLFIESVHLCLGRKLLARLITFPLLGLGLIKWAFLVGLDLLVGYLYVSSFY